MTGAETKNLDAPDERVKLEGVAADVVQVGDASISWNVFQPGAHCALGGRRLGGNHRAQESCQAHHSGVVISGVLHLEMDDGSELEIGPNDVFDIPPGHDGWVVSEEPWLAINWSGVRSWLPDPGFGDRVLATLLFTDIVGSASPATIPPDMRPIVSACPGSAHHHRWNSNWEAANRGACSRTTRIGGPRTPRPSDAPRPSQRRCLLRGHESREPTTRGRQADDGGQRAQASHPRRVPERVRLGDALVDATVVIVAGLLV